MLNKVIYYAVCIKCRNILLFKKYFEKKCRKQKLCELKTMYSSSFIAMFTLYTVTTNICLISAFKSIKTGYTGKIPKLKIKI